MTESMTFVEPDAIEYSQGCSLPWGYGSRKELMGAGAEQLLEQPRDLGRLSSTHGSHRTAASRNEG